MNTWKTMVKVALMVCIVSLFSATTSFAQRGNPMVDLLRLQAPEVRVEQTSIEKKQETSKPKEEKAVKRAAEVKAPTKAEEAALQEELDKENRRIKRRESRLGIFGFFSQFFSKRNKDLAAIFNGLIKHDVRLNNALNKLKQKQGSRRAGGRRNNQKRQQRTSNRRTVNKPKNDRQQKRQRVEAALSAAKKRLKKSGADPKHQKRFEKVASFIRTFNTSHPALCSSVMKFYLLAAKGDKTVGAHVDDYLEAIEAVTQQQREIDAMKVHSSSKASDLIMKQVENLKNMSKVLNDAKMNEKLSTREQNGVEKMTKYQEVLNKTTIMYSLSYAGNSFNALVERFWQIRSKYSNNNVQKKLDEFKNGTLVHLRKYISDTQKKSKSGECSVNNASEIHRKLSKVYGELKNLVKELKNEAEKVAQQQPAQSPNPQ